jgi:polyphenol oxidase
MHHWLMPDWPAPPGVRSLCSTRSGGVSPAPYDSLNLGDHVGDDPLAVAENRARLARQLGAHPVFLKQVHGTHTITLTAHTPDGNEADACVTDQPGVACTIMVADCLPLLFTNKQGTVVAAAHAGWRGLADGVIEQCIEGFRGLAGVNTAQLAIKNIASDILAWLGPCIGPVAFEVGPEVHEAFVARNAGADKHFVPQPGGKYLANLPALARQRLHALGITQIYGNDGSTLWCTVSNPQNFFSHRRDRVSGRFAACIWRV